MRVDKEPPPCQTQLIPASSKKELLLAASRTAGGVSAVKCLKKVKLCSSCERMVGKVYRQSVKEQVEKVFFWSRSSPVVHEEDHGIAGCPPGVSMSVQISMSQPVEHSTLEQVHIPCSSWKDCDAAGCWQELQFMRDPCQCNLFLIELQPMGVTSIGVVCEGFMACVRHTTLEQEDNVRRPEQQR